MVNYMSYTPNAPVVSTVNSTTTPLAGGATFTGTWERAPRSMVMVQAKTDADGTLFFDFSVDGINADSTFPVSGTDIYSGIPTVQPAAVGGRYFRVRVVNGASAQTYLRLETSYSEFTNFYSPLDQSYNHHAPSILTRQSWTWLDVARGLAQDIASVKKFGRNPSVGTSFVPVTLGGLYNTPQSSAATTLRVKAGGNANDTAAGSGARSVTLVGLDENFLEVTETIATAGASASSATSATFTRLYRAYVASSGTYATAIAGSHSGNIVIENGAGGTDWATIDATTFPKSQTEIGAFSVPTGATGYVKLRNVSVDSGKTIDLVFFSRSNIDETAAPYSAIRAQSVVSGVAGGSIEVFGNTDIPFGPYVGPTDIGFMAKVSTGTASVSVEFEVFIVT